MANQAQGDLRRGEARRTATVGIAPDSGETASRRLSVPTSADSGGSLPSTVASPTRSIPRQEVSAAPGNRGPEGANGVGIPWPAAFRAPARFHAADPGLNPALQPSDVPTPTRFERRARGTPGADVRPIVERTDRFPATPSAPSVRSFSRTSDSLPDGGATRVREAGTDAMREGMRGEMRGETHGDLRGERAGGRPANGAVPEDPTRLDVRSSRPRTVGEAPVGRPLMADSVASAVSGRGEVQRNPAPREGGIPPLTSAERPATPIPARMAYVPEAAPTATPSRSWDVTDRGGPGGAPGLTGGRTDAGRDTAFPPSGRHPSSLVSPTSAPERVRETPRSRDAREPRAEGEAVDRSRGPAAEARGTGDSASSEVAKRESVETRGRQDTGMDGATAPAGSRTSRREAAEAFLAEVGTVSADAMLGMRKGRKSDKPARDEGPNLPGARQLSPSVPADRPGMPVAEAAGTGGVVARARQDIDWPQPVQRALSEPMLEGGLEGGEVIPTSSLSPAERVHRLESLIHREVMLVRRFGAETMSVVLRPDSETELMLNLRQMDGYVEAAVRCDRGDLGDLRGYWRELQETLAAQNVRLLPAPETLSHSSILEAPTHHGSRTSFGEDRPSRQADPDPNPERPGGESRQRSSSSETPSESPENPAPRRAVRRAGWESWA